jgi:crotonobetainyl-CoA:carnitine CoA-transferase CaiB-like acyl-CoA transferase
MASGPLVGIRVLDITQVIAGPLAGMLLSDLGAEVIKVEPPEGEPWRLTGQFMPGESRAYQSLNRGKQSIALDLTNRTCQEAVHRLVRACDVVIINYRPDVSARLGIDYETLRGERPDLIYVDSTAFGRKGPWAHRAGYDIVAQAASGILAHRLATDERGNPVIGGQAAPADFATGYAIALGVCAALFQRAMTGTGQLVETSLLANALVLQGNGFMSSPATDGSRRTEFLEDLRRVREAGGNFYDFVKIRKAKTPEEGGIYYRAYLTKDGALAVGCLSPATRAKMRQALRLDELLAARGESEAVRVSRDTIRQIEQMLLQMPMDHWMQIFDRHGVPASPVFFVEELDGDPQVVENEYVVDLEHDLTGPQRMAAPPIKMSATSPAAQGAAPPLGRDTRPILASLGFSAEQIEELVSSGAAKAW